LQSSSTGPTGPGAPLLLGAALLVLSGFGALVVETTWLRWFRLLLGATAPAASATLVAFFAGHAVGALLGARGAARLRRPLRAYGWIELAAAAAAAAVPLLLALGRATFDPAYDSLRERPGLLVATRFGLAMAATFPAALAFGATLPVLAATVVGRLRALGSRGAALYGANTLGAAGGAAATSFWLPEALGVTGAYVVGVGALAAAGGLALAASHWAGEAPIEPAPPSAKQEAAGVPVAPGRGRRRLRGRHGAVLARAARRGNAAPRALAARALMSLAFLSGLGSFAAQVLFVQAFALVLNQSTYAFGAVLVVVLGALGLGALLAAAWAGTGRGASYTLLGAVLAASALGLAAFPAAFAAATDGLTYLGSERPWPGYLARALGLAAALAGPTLLAGGLVFPTLLALAGAGAGTESPGARLGRLVAANTLGAIAGALAAPYLLLPLLGPWGGLLAVAVLYGAAAVFVPAETSRARMARDLALGLGWLLILTRASPLAAPLVSLGPGERALLVETTPAGVVAVVEHEGELRLQTDNHYALGGTRDRVRQERQGHVPLLLAGAPRAAAFLGSATGSSAAAALDHGVAHVALVEIVPGVARAAALFFHATTGGIYARPEAEVVLDDARNYLRATRARFDAIVGDLFVPWRAGAGSLYTHEHFQAARARLSERGVFCQWLPLYQLSEQEFRIVAATFRDVFPQSALFRGDFFGSHPIAALVGYAGPPPSAEEVAEATRRLAAAGVGDRWVVDPLGFWSLYVGPLAALAEELEDAPRNRDDRPEIEFRAARTHAGGQRGKEEPLVGLRLAALAERLRAAAAQAGDPVHRDLPPAARRAADGGQALQLAGALFVAGRTEEARRALAAAAARLPPHLLAEGDPDPSAAELWWAEP
jgi:spermidine synthase